MARTQPRRAASNRFVSEGSPLTSDEEAEEQTGGSRPKRTAARKSKPTAKAITSSRRRSRAEEQDEEDEDGAMDVDETESVDSFDSGSEKDMDETDDYIAPGGKSAKGKKPRIAKSKPSKTSKVAAAAGGSSTAAKARTASTTLTKKSKGAATVRGGARVMVNKAELEIKDDINLFNALKNSEVAVQAVVDDWVVEYQSEPGPALVELINFVIRCCGCNSTVDEAAVMDLDNVVDALEQVQEQFKKSPNPSYPIVSRAPAFKKFKSSLAEFFERLVMTASDSELLLTAPITAQSSELVAEPPLINVLKEWLSSFSSSTFRSFRHTSTFIVLHIVRATASLVITKRQNVESIRKQRDAEKKKPRVDKTRVKALDDKWREAKEEDATLMDGIRDFIDSVYQHRYRDADPLIRTDCAQELGRWIKKQPEIFMKNEYTRYLGWCLSDTSGAVRVAAIQALAQVYSESSFPDPLRHFTELFKARLVQMAVCDIELPVRAATIDVLVHIERRGLLEDDQRDEIGLHIFDVEPRIRQEIARFLTGLVEEEVRDTSTDIIGPAPAARGKDAKAKEDRAKWEAEVEKLRLKILAQKLVEYEATLDDNGSSSAEQPQQKRSRALPPAAAQSTLLTERGGRISLAVQALWSFEKDTAPLSGWSNLLEMLLYDHSTETQGLAASKKGRGGRKGPSSVAVGSASAVGYSGSQPPNEAYRLEATEETVLLEALVAIADEFRRLAHAAATLAAAANKGDDDENVHQEKLDDFTRALIPALPKLFAKYRTESARVSEVLLLVPQLNLNLYAASGQASALAHLWDEVSGQFSRHSEDVLLKRGASAIRALVGFAQTQSSLDEVTTTKLLTLQESLINALREPLKGKEVATSALDEDTIFALQANLQRLAGLSGATDCSEVIEDTEGGQVTSGWEILREVASRGKLGYEGEEAMVSNCLRVITIHLLWKLRALMASSLTTAEEDRQALIDAILVQRTEALELMEDLVTDRTVVLREVKVLAAARMLQIYLAFHAAEQSGSARNRKIDVNRDEQQEGADVLEESRSMSRLRVFVPRPVQEGCVTVVLAELDMQIQTRQEEDREANGAEDPDDEIEDDEGDEDEAERPQKRNDTASKKTNGSHQSVTKLPTQAQLQREVELNQLTAPLVSAMRFGLVDINLAAPIIGKFGRLGQMFDVLVKLLIEVLREDGVLANDGKGAADVVLDSLRESFESYLVEGTAEGEARFVSLSRSISSALVIRGAHLAILRAIDPPSLLHLHKRGAEYVAKKWKAAEQANNKAVKARAPAFWKGLGNLLISATARDAHKIKSAMEQAILDAGIEVPPASKSWDPQRQYEKRLVTLMAKRAPPPAPRAAAAAGATPRKGSGRGSGSVGGSASKARRTATNTNDEIDDEEEDFPNRVLPLASTPVQQQQRPRARPAGPPGSAQSSAAKRGRKRTAADADEEDEEEGEAAAQDDSGSLSSAPSSPRSAMEEEEQEEEEVEQEEEEEEVRDDESLPGSRKRRRRI